MQCYREMSDIVLGQSNMSDRCEAINFRAGGWLSFSKTIFHRPSPIFLLWKALEFELVLLFLAGEGGGLEHLADDAGTLWFLCDVGGMFFGGCCQCAVLTSLGFQGLP